MHGFETLLDGDLSFTECPRWHDGRLVFSDFYTHRVRALDLATGELEELAVVAGQHSGLGWLPDGDLLVVSMRDRLVLRRGADGSLRTHADLSRVPEVTGHLNDMLVDDRGRAYVGNFGYDLMGGAEVVPTVLVRVDPDGATSVVADGLRFPNGMVLTPDGGTLVVAETLGGRLTAFDVGADGDLSAGRTWAQLPEGTAPDGICLDAEGAVWLADAMGARLLRVREGGEVLEERTPGTGVFACMLVGEDGRTLVGCAAPSFLEHERATTRHASLVATRVDVGGHRPAQPGGPTGRRRRADGRVRPDVREPATGDRTCVQRGIGGPWPHPSPPTDPARLPPA